MQSFQWKAVEKAKRQFRLTETDGTTGSKCSVIISYTLTLTMSKWSRYIYDCLFSFLPCSFHYFSLDDAHLIAVAFGPPSDALPSYQLATWGRIVSSSTTPVQLSRHVYPTSDRGGDITRKKDDKEDEEEETGEHLPSNESRDVQCGCLPTALSLGNFWTTPDSKSTQADVVTTQTPPMVNSTAGVASTDAHQILSAESMHRWKQQSADTSDSLSESSPTASSRSRHNSINKTKSALPPVEYKLPHELLCPADFHKFTQIRHMGT